MHFLCWSNIIFVTLGKRKDQEYGEFSFYFIFILPFCRSCFLVRDIELKEKRKRPNQSQKRQQSKDTSGPILSERVECRFCPQTFKTQHFQHRHERQFHGVKKLECVDCSRSFKCYKGLNNHNLLQHGKTTIKCRLCGDFKLKSVESFMGHYRKEHFEAGDVECFSCDQQVRKNVECLL